MLIAIDAGNTNITFAIFDGDLIIRTFRLETVRNASIEEYCEKITNGAHGFTNKINSAIIASVVDELSETVANAVKRAFNVEPLIVSPDINTGVVLKTDRPSEVGADRIANAAAVAALYPLPCIAADLGTATSFDIVNEKKEFSGGIITAGINMQLKALASNTSKLPLLKIEFPEKSIGKNTKEAILSGVVRGHARMIEGLLADCEKELGTKPTVVITGGCSRAVSKYIRYDNTVNPDLTLIGLKIIYNLNA